MLLLRHSSNAILRSKWEAWTSFNGISQDKAMTDFIDLIQSIQSKFSEEHSTTMVSRPLPAVPNGSNITDSRRESLIISPIQPTATSSASSSTMNHNQSISSQQQQQQQVISSTALTNSINNFQYLLIALLLPVFLFYLIGGSGRGVSFIIGIIIIIKYLLYKYHLGTPMRKSKNSNIPAPLVPIPRGRTLVRMPIDLGPILRFLDAKKKKEAVAVVVDTSSSSSSTTTTDGDIDMSDSLLEILNEEPAIVASDVTTIIPEITKFPTKISDAKEELNYQPQGTSYCICSQCKTAYLIDITILSSKGLRVQCNVCDKDWFQTPERLMRTDEYHVITKMNEDKVLQVKKIIAEKNFPKYPRVDKVGVFIGNLPYTYTEKEIGDLFGEYGLTNIALVKDAEQQSKGYGFLEVTLVVIVFIMMIMMKVMMIMLL